MSAASELQKAIHDALVADAAVGALVGDRIYDGVPSNAEFPYVSFGVSQQVTDDMDCIDGEQQYLQIDAWGRSQGRTRICKDIVAAVKGALHQQDLDLANGHALANLQVESIRVFLDSDGITAHGVISLRADVEVSVG